MSSLRFVLTAAAALLATGLTAAACISSDPGGTGASSGMGGKGNDAGTAGTGGGNGTIPSAICLLHNCTSDVDCAACTSGHTTCLTSEHRCVACNAGGATGCPAGQKCSSFGNCVGESLTCPTNGGIPTITCNTSADCAACDPAHQVCDATAHKCVACTTSDVSQCQSTETCVGGDCSPKCPASCAADGDCASCGAPGNEAHVCNSHKCAPCSPTQGCTGGLSCDIHGTCAATCGASGQPTGVCTQDADCTGCTGSATKCNNVPIGGGTGKCGPPAAGCSDLGMGVVVLPPPFDKVTQACSNDMDCASIGINLNVGAILRDISGWDQIHDATLMYPEHVCASVSIENKSCGVCVPCKVDSDCQSIPVDQIVGEAFGPLGKIATDFLLDQIFGPNDHQVHMYCETVADGYGVCAPCPGIVNDCGVGTAPTGTTCDPAHQHDVCTTGAQIDPGCDACAVKVCTDDLFCCTVEWDQTCVNEVAEACGHACESCSQASMGGHDKCQAGGALKETCSECVGAVCQAEPSCCMSAWDQSCIDKVPAYCSPAYLCQGQCKTIAQCTGTQGCLADYTCGPCVADYDCTPKKCDTMSGQCQ